VSLRRDGSLVEASGRLGALRERLGARRRCVVERSRAIVETRRRVGASRRRLVARRRRQGASGDVLVVARRRLVAPSGWLGVRGRRLRASTERLVAPSGARGTSPELCGDGGIGPRLCRQQTVEEVDENVESSICSAARFTVEVGEPPAHNQRLTTKILPRLLRRLLVRVDAEATLLWSARYVLHEYFSYQ
jgi:hypothetical protein